ncbi:MAG: c-type cytochrome [Anaerolineales bacterium]|nr:c-type cytochrome [Anaerolineales bacterium]
MKRAGLFLSLVSAGLWLSACSLAGDITPPPGSRPVASIDQTVPTEAPVVEAAPVDVSAALPSGRPSAASGSALFAAHCAECHGATGASDGASVAKLPAPPPQFSDPATLRGLTPREVYATITLGRLENFMPPFANSLTDAERWDLAAYVYTLSTTQAEIDDGQALYSANCGECHGADGATLQDWTAADYLAATSPQQIYTAIQTGVPEIADHVFASTLDESQLWSVVNYARTLSYTYLAPGAPLPEQAGTIVGQLANGSAGGTTPDALDVTLLGFTDMNLVGTYTTTSDATGSFTFEAVPFTDGEQFILTTEYGGATYHSDVFAFESGDTSAQVALPIYDVTESADNIRITQLHTFLMFEGPGSVTVGQMAVISNDGDTTYAPADGQSIRFAVPAGATGVTAPDGLEGETFAVTEGGYADLRPVPPGDSTLQVFFQYQLPYSGQLDFAQRLDYPADVANLLVGDTQVSVTGENVSDLGVQTIQGLTFQQFQRDGLAAGDTLAFNVSGAASAVDPALGDATGATTTAVSTDDTLSLGIGLGALSAVAAGLGLWWYRRRQAPAVPASASGAADGPITREDWLLAIAELDDEHAAGKLSEPEYRRERAWLLAELQKVWDAEG